MNILKSRFPIILIGISSLLQIHANAQGLSVKGLVFSSETKLPLVGATIKLDKSTHTDKTDEDGAFSIYIKTLSKQSLIISSVGYKAQKISISNYKEGEVIKVNLVNLSISLNEVVIQDNSAATIVAKAYYKIPENYPDRDSFYEGFFRESSFLIDKEGKQKTDYIIESVTDMKKGTYARASSNDEIKLRETKKAMTIDSGSRARWLGGIVGPYRSDLVKKRAEYLNPKYQYRYSYKKLKDTTIYNRTVYAIKFEPKANANYKGIIYIDVKTYAFVEIRRSLTEAGLKHHYTFFLIKPKVQLGVFSINYFPKNEKWFLNSMYHRADIDLSEKLHYLLINEYVTTAIDTLRGAAFNENVSNNQILWESLAEETVNTDSVFWKNYRLKALSNNKSSILIDTAIKPLEGEKDLQKVLEQGKGYIVKLNLHKLTTKDLIGYQYERGIAKTQTVLFDVGLAAPKWKNVYPVLRFGYRNYYTIEKRLKQEKSVWNNSANYFGVNLKLSTKNEFFTFNSSDDEPNPTITFGPVWGIQREGVKHLGYTYYFGAKVTNLTFSKSMQFKWDDLIDIGGSISYSF